MSRLWLLLVIFGTSNGQITGEYKIIQPQRRLGLQVVGEKLQLTPTPTIWLVKEYRSGYFVIQDLMTGNAFTKVHENSLPTVLVRPRTMSRGDNQKWLVSQGGTISTVHKPPLFVEYGKRGPLYLAPGLNTIKQKFRFKQLRRYGIFGEDVDAREQYTTRRPTTRYTTKLTTTRPTTITTRPATTETTMYTTTSRTRRTTKSRKTKRPSRHTTKRPKKTKHTTKRPKPSRTPKPDVDDYVCY